jgi:hypothetical protein
MRRLIFWEFPRTSWQYDVVVALILAFIVLTPREIFRDQPRAANVVQISSSSKEVVFLIDAASLSGTAPALRPQRAVELVQKRTGKKMQFLRLEEVADSEDDVNAYMAFLKP